MDRQNSILHRKRIGELLIEAGILRGEQLPIGLKEAQRRSLRLGEVLVALRYLSAEDLEIVLLAQAKLHEGVLTEKQTVAAIKHSISNRVPFETAMHVVQELEESKRWQYQLELGLLQERLVEAERMRGAGHRESGIVCTSIADLHAENGEVEEAERLYKRAVQIFERSFGRRHLRVANVQSKLAELMVAQGRLKDAEMLYWLVLDTTQGAWGQEHLQVAACHRALAQLLEAQSRLRESEQFYLSCLRIIEKVAGPESPEMTEALRDLAAFWRKQGKKPSHIRLGDLLLEAGILDQENLDAALAYCKKSNCPLGQGLVKLNYISLDDLRPALQAQLLITDGVLPSQLAAQALRLTRQGLQFEEALRQLGWEPDTFTTEELTVLIAIAEELISAEAALGPEHAGVAVLSMKLADKYAAQKRFSEAEPLYKRCLSILEKSFGAEDAEVATALARLAHLYVLEGQPPAAEPLLLRALDIRRKVKGKRHLDVAECLDLLGLVYERQERPADAEHYYQLALNIKEELLGLSNERTRETLERLANALYFQGKLAEAEDIFVRLLRAREKETGTAALWRAPLLQRLAEIHAARKDYGKAEKSFQQALEIHEQIDKSSLEAAELMEKFANLLETMGRLEESKEWMEKAQTAKRLRS